MTEQQESNLLLDPMRPGLASPVETVYLTADNVDQCRTHLHLVLPRQSPLPWFHYNIHDLVHIRSKVRLPELAFFAVTNGKHKSRPRRDIEIVVGEVGTRAPRTKVSVLQGDGIFVYLDQLGKGGASFRIEYGKTIRVIVSQKLARSPHVTYTNIIEALLRYVIASKGSVLQHSAGIVLNGQAVLLTAKTDTGKTSTILQMLEMMAKEHTGQFLSDDMTILGPDGTAHSFPKPLTISAHTLKAVNARRLPWHLRAALMVQSQVHSKAGRGIGLWLATRPLLPIMFVNTLTQRLIPPPKYDVQRLVDCEIIKTAKIQQIILIARGEHSDSTLGAEDALEQLVANNADAYTFPPFTQVRDSIQINGMTAEQLEILEDEVRLSVVGSVGGVVSVYSRNDFGWRRPILRNLGVVPHLEAAEHPVA